MDPKQPKKKPAAKPRNIVAEMADQAAGKAVAEVGPEKPDPQSELAELQDQHQKLMAQLGAISCRRDDAARALRELEAAHQQVRAQAAEAERKMARLKAGEPADSV